MTTSSVQLSVVIPTYRRGAALARVLEALRQQTARSVCDLVLVDQNPAGQTQAQLGSKLLSDVTYVWQQEPNVSLARNTGFMRSVGELVLFLDDDACPEPDFLERLLRLFDQFPHYQCIAPLVYAQAGIDAALKFYERFLEKPWDQFGIGQRVDTATGIIAFRRQCFLRAGGFDPLLFRFARTAEDMELFFRMRAQGMPVWIARDWQLFHDESQPGGCELRTEDWWHTRARCMRALALRYLVHGSGQFSLADRMRFLRSAIINRGVLFAGLKATLRHARVARTSAKQAREFYRQHQHYYEKGLHTNHLQQQTPQPLPTVTQGGTQ